MARINNTWYGEFYAPVDSDNVEARQQFYAYAEEAIAAMRHQDSSIPMIIVGDFNGHISFKNGVFRTHRARAETGMPSVSFR